MTLATTPTAKTREQFEAAWTYWAKDSAWLCMAADANDKEYNALQAQLKDLIKRAADRAYGAAA